MVLSLQDRGTVTGTQLHYGDFIVIFAYFIFVLFVGLWTSRKNRGSAGGYFLAGRNMHWIPVGASLFASNIGSIHFVGLAGSGAASGIGVGLYELNALYILMILGYFFLPVYIASGVYTMPEYMKRRFGGQRIQIYLAVLALLVYIFTKISADLYAGAIFIEQSLRWDIYGAIMLLLGVAAVFTITGGLTAVIWTDFIQTIIMIVGAFVLMILSFNKVGGLNGMIEKYPDAIANSSRYSNLSCGKPREDYMHLFRDARTGDFPWPGLIGISINSIWYWCSDQVIVQRALAGKSYDHGKAGTIECGYFKILPLFLLVFPGMIARILFPDTVACADPETCMRVCGIASGCSNIAYPSLVINLMPPGARGMMLAVMMAALMSSLTSIFNSSSTIFAMDIWTRIRKSASELEIMIVGRVFVAILVVISILWIPVIRASQGSDLFVYIQQVSSFMQPPICCVFLLGLFWSRINEAGAFYSLVIGMTLGLIRFIVEYSYTIPDCTTGLPDPRPAIIKDFHYLYFSPFLFVSTGVSAIVISLLTKPVDSRCIQRLTFWTRHSKKPRLDIDRWLEQERKQGSGRKDSMDQDQYQMKDVRNMEIAEDGAAGDRLTEGKTETEADHRDKVKESTNKEREPLVSDVTEGMDAARDNGLRQEKRVKVHDMTGKDTEKDLLKPESSPGGQSETEVETRGRETCCTDENIVVRKTIQWVCGVDESNRHYISSHQIKEDDMVSITEHPQWKIVSNVSAVILMVLALAFFIYFG